MEQQRETTSDLLCEYRIRSALCRGSRWNARCRARVAFHAVPRYSDDTLAQPLESVGTQARFGDSSGCIRVRPADSVAIWDHLAIGDQVAVIS